MKNRSGAIDVVRVFGVLAVIAGHLWAGQADSPNALRIAVYSWHVPIFFFFTGYLWSDGRTVGREAKSRARSLLIPFALWTLIFGTAIYSVMTLRTGFPSQEILDTIYGGGRLRGYFAPYWFIPILFLTAVLFRAVQGMPAWFVWAIASLGLGATHLWGDALSELPQDIAFAVPCLYFVLVGKQVRRVTPDQTRLAPLGLLLLAFSAAALATGMAAPLDMKLGDFGTPGLSVVVATAISTGLLWLCQGVLGLRHDAWMPFVAEIAQTSVVILLTHTFAFSVFRVFGLPSPIVFVGSATASAATALIIHRTPLSPWLAGVPRVVRPSSRSAADVGEEPLGVSMRGSDHHR